MIAVQVGDKNMRDPVVPYLVFQHLHLRPFTTVNEKMAVAKDQKLWSWMTIVNRGRWTAAQNGKLKTHRTYLREITMRLEIDSPFQVMVYI